MSACFRLAWVNLAERKTRALVAQGICFAIFLLFLQLGCLDATRRAAAAVCEFFEFDPALSLAIGLTSALVSLRRCNRADPAELF